MSDLWLPINDDEEEEDKPDMPSNNSEDKTSAFILERLLKSRKIVISSEINQKIADKIINYLIILEEEDQKKPIIVYINSPGGEVYSGFAIYVWRWIKYAVTYCRHPFWFHFNDAKSWTLDGGSKKNVCLCFSWHVFLLS